MPGKTRWETARSAISSVITTWNNEIRFGLSLYPEPCDEAFCSAICYHSSSQDYCEPCPTVAGSPDVTVDAGTTENITTAIAATAPGGNTPTQLTLLAVEADRNGFGLPLADDPIDRNNYVLLVTDGDANEGVEDGQCGTDPDQADLVNCVINRLHVAEVPVDTFVVGFAFGGSPANLDCHAYYGGTARIDQCPDINADNCDSQSGTCYYPADNEAELVNAMTDIVGSVTSCDYSLGNVTGVDDELLSVYLYHQCDTLSVDDCPAKPGCQVDGSACIGDPVRVERDANGWEYDEDTNQVRFLGDSCTTVQAGGVVPVVILGCGTGGE